MPALSIFANLLFAQGAPRGGDNSGGATWLAFLWIPIIVYFFFIRPTQKQERQRREMLSAMKKNDKVITESGIFGTVISIDPDGDKVVLRVDDDRGVKMTFIRSKVVKVLESAAAKEKEKEKEKAAEAV